MLIIFTGFALVDILVYFINNNLCGDNTHLIADMLFSDRNQFSTSTCRAITVLFRDIQNDNIAFCLGKVKLLLRTLFRAFVCLNRRSSFSGLRRGFPLHFVKQGHLVRVGQYYPGAFRFGRKKELTHRGIFFFQKSYFLLMT